MAKSTRKKLKEKKEYWLVEASFYDHAHCNGDHALADCKVWGVLHHETKEAYFIATWVTESDPDSTSSDVYCIIKKALLAPIKKICKVKEV